jgi:hypothetical protein
MNPTAPWFDLDVVTAPDLLGGFLICLFTLAIFSFLYKDNPFYKLAEHVFIGVGTAWYTMEYYESGVLQPLVHYLHDTHGALNRGEASVQLGGYPVAPGWAITFRLMAVALSIMLLARLVKRNAWISRWPLALIIGIYAALKMTSETQARLVQQIRQSMVPLRPEDGSLLGTFGNLVLVLGLVCVLAHFIFTYKRTTILGGVSRVGIVILMLAFGSRFGFTVLGRIALLIQRVAELADYTEPAYSLAPGAPVFLRTALTPTWLIFALIVAVLAVGALSRRARQT